MKCLFSFILLFLAFELRAFPLPSDHFLAPRDFEPLWLAGIEAPSSYRSLLRNLENCDRESNFLGDFRKFHCSLSKELSSAPTLPAYNETNFGDITFFGETHYNQKGQRYLAEVLKNSPNGFFTTLALEMFNEWAQPEIDHLIESKAPLSDWEKLLNKHWNYRAEGYLEVIKIALEKNLKIIAIDDRRKERQFEHSDNFSEDLIYRDEVMAKNLINHLEENPNAKVVALTGKMHSFNNISESPISVANLIKDTMGEIKTTHYMLFTIKKATLFRSLNPEKELPYRLKATNRLKKYADFYLFF